MEYGKKMLEFRAKHNLTQTKLANILGVNTNMVHRYEVGKNKPTSVNQIRFDKKMEEYEKWGTNV